MLHDRIINNICDFGKNQALFYACYLGYYDMVKLLLKDKRVNFYLEGSRFNAVSLSLQHPWYHITKLLMSDERFDPTFDYFIEIADVESIRLLLSHPEVNPNNPTLVETAMISVNSNVLHILMAHPQFNPTFDYNKGLIQLIEEDNMECLEELIDEDRVPDGIKKILQMAIEGEAEKAIELLEA